MLVSWNYRHLVSYQRELKINAVNAGLGYFSGIRILAPPEVTEDEVERGPARSMAGSR